MNFEFILRYGCSDWTRPFGGFGTRKWEQVLHK